MSRGERVVAGIEQVGLTSSGQSAFVGWAGQHADPEHLQRWGQLLDLLEERFPA